MPPPQPRERLKYICASEMLTAYSPNQITLPLRTHRQFPALEIPSQLHQVGPNVQEHGPLNRYGTVGVPHRIISTLAFRHMASWRIQNGVLTCRIPYCRWLIGENGSVARERPGVGLVMCNPRY